jgi:mono/diheme cytochrome c family protein
MRPLSALGILALICALLLAGCASPRRGEPLVGPVALAADATQGEQVFMRHCHQCHPKGEAGLGPALNDKPMPGFLIRFQVRNGLGAMPAFSRDEIGRDELDDLVAYLAALRHAG